MSAIDTLAAALYGNPPTPGYKPSRAGVLAAFTELYGMAAGAVTGAVPYANVAALPASSGTQKIYLVTSDTTVANNGYWQDQPGGNVILAQLNAALKGAAGTNGTNGTLSAANASQLAAGTDNTTSITPAGLATLGFYANRAAMFTKLFTLPGYYRLSTGVYVPDATWMSTPLIEIAYIDIGKIDFYGNTAVAGIAFYDASKNYISGVSVATTGNRITAYPTPPGGTKYVGFSEFVSDQATATFNPIMKQSALPDSGLAVGSITYDAGLLLTLPGYIKADGATSNTDANWLHSDYITGNPGDVIAVRLGGHNIVAGLTQYDGNGKVLSVLSAAAANTALISTVTLGAGVRSYRISAAKPGGSAAVAIPTGGNSAVHTLARPAQQTRDARKPAAVKAPYINVLSAGALLDPFRSPQKISLSSTSLVGLSGDSISSTDYTFYRDAMAALTGASVSALGFSGSTVAQQAGNTYLTTIQSYLDAGVGDALLVHLPGGNDNGAIGTVGTFSGFVTDEPLMTETDITTTYAGTTFIQAVDHYVRYMLKRYSNPRVRAALIGSETESQKNAKIAAVVKPKIVLCTNLPQQRSADASYGLLANLERKRAAIIEVGHKNNVHTVDLFRMGAFDMTIEPQYTAPTDKVTNNGVFFMDGLHPNQFGAQRNAGIIFADSGLAS